MPLRCRLLMGTLKGGAERGPAFHNKRVLLRCERGAAGREYDAGAAAGVLARMLRRSNENNERN